MLGKEGLHLFQHNIRPSADTNHIHWCTVYNAAGKWGGASRIDHHVCIATAAQQRSNTQDAAGLPALSPPFDSSAPTPSVLDPAPWPRGWSLPVARGAVAECGGPGLAKGAGDGTRAAEPPAPAPSPAGVAASARRPAGVAGVTGNGEKNGVPSRDSAAEENGQQCAATTRQWDGNLGCIEVQACAAHRTSGQCAHGITCEITHMRPRRPCRHRLHGGQWAAAAQREAV